MHVLYSDMYKNIAIYMYCTARCFCRDHCGGTLCVSAAFAVGVVVIMILFFDLEFVFEGAKAFN